LTKDLKLLRWHIGEKRGSDEVALQNLSQVPWQRLWYQELALCELGRQHQKP
jgi:hypothetical protein